MIDTAAKPSFDMSQLRDQFPALQQVVRGRVPAFFDNPAGTQVPLDVIDAVRDIMTTSNSYPHGNFSASERSSDAVDGAHAAMADMLGAASPEQIVIGPNMTTVTFAMSRAIGRGLSAGDEVVVTNLDHDGNVAPWRALEERGVVIRVVDINPADCTLDMNDLAAKIGPRTHVVAVTHCSNLVGSIVDVTEVCRLARQSGAISYIDAVQYAAHGTIDVQAIDCDFLVCSSYKFFGPHLGILYGKRERLDAIHPYKVRPASESLPGRFETGAPSVEGCAALLGTMNYLQHVGTVAGPSDGGAETGRRGLILQAMRAFRAQEMILGRRLLEGLARIPGVRIWGITDPARMAERVPTVSFTLAGHHPDEIADSLAKQEIYVWSGNNYALSLTERLDLERSGGVVRVGPVHYNTAAEIDRLLEHVDALARKG
jgi:cysteine desulfurase family protein (TIGR01976 family)